MHLNRSGFACITALALAALACNASRAAQTPSPSAEGEMSLAEALEVPAEDRRPEVLRLLGAPDAFTLRWQELDGQLVRWEEWSYFDLAARFDFVDGELVWTVDLDPPPDGSIYALGYNPLDFDSTMTVDEVRARLSDQTLEEASLAEADIPSGVVLAGDQILLGFEGDRLVYVQTFILSPGEGELSTVSSPSPPPETVVPPVTAALLTDEFEGASPARPLFGPEYMTFTVENGQGSLTARTPGGVLPVMYATPQLKDFALEVDVRFPEARPESVAGIIFRSDDAADGLAHYYHLAFRPASAQVSLDLWKDGAWASVEAAPIGDGILDATGLDRLRLEADSGLFRLFVNGVLVLEAADARLADAGIVGLSIVADQVPETVYFDNLRIEPLGG